MKENLIIELKNLSKSYPVADDSFFALKNVTTQFVKGEFSGIVGPSGSGKTTLLNILGSLDQPTTGTATVLGRDISNLSHQSSANLRNYHIGFIFQVFNHHF